MKKARPTVEDVVRLLVEFGPLVNTSIAGCLHVSDSTTWYVIDEGIRARKLKAVTFRRPGSSTSGARNRVVVYALPGTDVELMRAAIPEAPPLP